MATTDLHFHGVTADGVDVLLKAERVPLLEIHPQERSALYQAAADGCFRLPDGTVLAPITPEEYDRLVAEDEDH